MVPLEPPLDELVPELPPDEDELPPDEDELPPDELEDEDAPPLLLELPLAPLLPPDEDEEEDEPPPPLELPSAGPSSPQPTATAIEARRKTDEAPTRAFLPRATVRTLRFIGTALAYGRANCKLDAFSLVRRPLPATLKASTTDRRIRVA